MGIPPAQVVSNAINAADIKRNTLIAYIFASEAKRHQFEMFILRFLYLLIFCFSSIRCAFGAEQRKHIICYQGTWSTYRASLGKFSVEDIDPFHCTHLMYAFFGIEASGHLRIIDPYLDLEDNGGRGNIRKFNALKLQNPTLKTFAAVGGWNEGSQNFSIVAADPQKRARFVIDVVKFLQRHGFDGLDLDWEYPNQRHNLDNDDKTNYIILLKELKDGLEPFGYLLSAAVGSAEFSAEMSYDIPKIADYLDIINVMAYDLHGPWDNVTGLNAPLYAAGNELTSRDRQLNIDAIVNYWLSNGAPREKLVLGVPFYGRSFMLTNVEQHATGAPHLGRGLAGQYSVEPGVIGYNEFCEKMLHEPSWQVVWDDMQQVPYAYKERNWVSFETPQSITLKAQFVMDNNLGGIMVWSLESDDFRGICEGGEKNPLLKQISRTLYGTNTPTGLTAAPAMAQRSTDLDKCANNIGYVRDPLNCSVFYYCEEAGNAHRFECPKSLRFDLNTSSCNYASSVIC